MPIQNVDVSIPASGTPGQGGIATLGSTGQKFDSVNIRFTTRGTYNDFMTLLKSLEASLRVVDLISLRLAPETAGIGAGTEPTYTYEVALRTYWLK